MRMSPFVVTFGAAALALLTNLPCRAEQPPTLAIGAPAPDFALPGVDGKTWKLADFSEKPVLVLIFTCNHCPTAQAYEERIMELERGYRDKGVALVAITPNDPLALRLDELGYSDVGDSFEDTVIRAKERGFAFPYLYDGEKQEVSRAYGPVSTPHAFVFDSKRLLRYAGRIDDSERIARVNQHDLRNAIDAVLSGAPVPVESTKTYGCSVKWSDKRESVAASLARWEKEEVNVEEIGLDGVRQLVANPSDRYRLINVWATWCGPCVAEVPELVTINRMYRGREFELVTISMDAADQRERVLEFLKKNFASMRNYRFSGEDPYELIEALDSSWEGALPYTIFVAPGGKILYRHMGAIDPLEVKRVIVEHLGRIYK